MTRIIASKELQDKCETQAKEKQALVDLSQRIYEIVSNEHITVEKQSTY